MEPASRNAWAMYKRVPEGISPCTKSEINASVMLLMMSSTAQAY